MELYYYAALSKTGNESGQDCREALQYDLYEDMLDNRAWKKGLTVPRRRIVLRTGIEVDTGDFNENRQGLPIIDRKFLATLRINLQRFASLLNRELCRQLGRKRSRIIIKISTAPGESSFGSKTIVISSELPAYFLHNPIMASFWHGMIYHLYYYSKRKNKLADLKTLQAFCKEIRQVKDYGYDYMPLQDRDWNKNLKKFLGSYRDKDFYTEFMKIIQGAKERHIYSGGRFPNTPNGYLSWCEGS